MNVSKLLVATLFFYVSAANAVTTYPVKCRSGGNTSYNISNSNNALRIGFTKAPAAAGQNGANLLPGQCAWVDRPINANEPSHISIKMGANFVVGAVVPSRDNTTFRSYLYASAQPWLYNFSTSDVILTLHVVSEGGYLVAPNP